MAKKKDKKKNKKWSGKYLSFSEYRGGKKKKNKKSRDFGVKSTGSKEMFKKLKKEFNKSAAFPKLEEARRTFNLRTKHGEIAGVTLKEFRELYPDKVALIPNLDRIVKDHANKEEDNIIINNTVFVPMLLNPTEELSIETVEVAIAEVSLMANAVISNLKKEKKIASIRDAEEEFARAGRAIAQEFRALISEEATDEIDSSNPFKPVAFNPDGVVSAGNFNHREIEI